MAASRPSHRESGGDSLTPAGEKNLHKDIIATIDTLGRAHGCFQVLREGRKSANIHVISGIIWGGLKFRNRNMRLRKSKAALLAGLVLTAFTGASFAQNAPPAAGDGKMQISQEIASKARDFMDADSIYFKTRCEGGAKALQEQSKAMRDRLSEELSNLIAADVSRSSEV